MQPLLRTARATGYCYLALGLSGMCGFLWARGQLYVAQDAAQTLAHVVEKEWLARLGVALEMSVVVSQAFTAFGFYRLFRSVESFAAGCLAACGLINAVAVMGSAACLATSLDVAFKPELGLGGSTASTVQLLYWVSGHFWGVGNLFFGLWLLPMGWLVRRSGYMPSSLGVILLVGGVGYVLGGFLLYLAPSYSVVSNLLVIPATIGEFWMIGYLLSIGVKRGALAHADEASI